MSNLVTAAKEAGLVKASAAIVEGVDNVDDRDLKIGSLVLVQDMLKVFTRKGIPAGSFVNTLTEQEVKNITFIPAFMQKRWYLMDNTGAMPKVVGSSTNENDAIFAGKIRHPLTEDQKANKVKAEVLSGFFVAAILNGEPIKIKFWKAAGYYAGQDLYNHARSDARASGLPLWGRKYTLTSKLVPPAHGNPDYYALVVTRGEETSEQERVLAKSLYLGFKGKSSATEDEVPF